MLSRQRFTDFFAKTFDEGECTPIKTLWVAYSGGVDSHALLHLTHQYCAEHSIPVKAIHINHGVHPDAERWSQHCVSVCESLGIPLTLVALDRQFETPAQDNGLEAALRDARYAAFADHIAVDEPLLLGQHQDDQVETFFLRLMRGSGPKGLASMQAMTRRHGLWLCRPLLDYSRDDILSYARQHELSWVNDDSNSDRRFDRNFLRHEVLPLLKSRWPALGESVSRSAQHCQSSVELNEQLAALQSEGFLQGACLSLEAWSFWTVVQRANIVRYWLAKNGVINVSTAVLNEIIQAAVCEEDKVPEVTWSDHSVRRYQQRLFLLSNDVVVNAHTDADFVLSWAHASDVLQLPNDDTLSISIDDDSLLSWPLMVRYRQGGERVRTVANRPSNTLKHWFQEQGIPPWDRPRTPLIFSDGVLICVGDHVVNQTLRESGLCVCWSRVSQKQ